MFETTANDSGRKTSFNSSGIQDPVRLQRCEHGFPSARPPSEVIPLANVNPVEKRGGCG
jgi:hypothetical protein